MRWYYLRWFLAGLAFQAALHFAIRYAEAAEAPQVIVRIVADDISSTEPTLYRPADFALPNINALAARGVNFTDANATTPTCLGSRTGMLFARYPQRAPTDIWTNPELHGEFPGTPRQLTTMAEALRQVGYVGGTFGKYAVKVTRPNRPLQNGYAEGLNLYTNGLGTYANPSLFIGNAPQKTKFFGNVTDILSAWGVDFLYRGRGRKLFLDMTYTAPHLRYEGATASQEARCAHLADNDRRGFCAAMMGLDDGVGAIVNQLQAQGILDRTLIIFAGDNGGEVGSVVAPLRGGKGTPYEGGTRVPMLISWPDHLPQGTEYGGLVSLMDIYPTAVSAAIGRTYHGAGQDGVSLLPFLRGRQDSPHDLLFFGTRPTITAVKRADGWKLIDLPSGRQLYHLPSDIGETRDLAKQHPQVVKQLEQPLRKWRAGLGPFRR